MHRQSIVAALARELNVSEREAVKLLRALAKVLAPFADKVPPVPSLPPYFERCLEVRFQTLMQSIEALEKRTEGRLRTLERGISEKFL